MNYNTIMVHLDLEGPAEPRLRFGWEIAGRFEADLIAFVAAEPKLVITGDDGGMAAEELRRQQLRQIETRIAELEREFQAVTGDAPRASWRAMIGETTRMLAVHARAADLIVSAGANGGQGAIDPAALVLTAGRPVLLHSDKLDTKALDRVVIGWKDSREARRATVDAMPFLAAAKDVVVIAVDDVNPGGARGSLADVIRFLMKHGVKARPEVVEVGGSAAGEALSQRARDLGAGLVVAGGYGHSRLREWIFGGVTKSLLADTSFNRLFSN
jgi:nucleotide-binding universal stress UspA family protein